MTGKTSRTEIPAKSGARALPLADVVVLDFTHVIAGPFAAMALAPTAEVEFAAIVLSGVSFYMFHNTLQTNGTQMAPEARGAGMALFALCLFLGQAIGVPIAAPICFSAATKTADCAAPITAGNSMSRAIALRSRPTPRRTSSAIRSNW